MVRIFRFVSNDLKMKLHWNAFGLVMNFLMVLVIFMVDMVVINFIKELAFHLNCFDCSCGCCFFLEVISLAVLVKAEMNLIVVLSLSVLSRYLN